MIFYVKWFWYIWRVWLYSNLIDKCWRPTQVYQRCCKSPGFHHLALPERNRGDHLFQMPNMPFQRDHTQLEKIILKNFWGFRNQPACSSIESILTKLNKLQICALSFRCSDPAQDIFWLHYAYNILVRFKAYSALFWNNVELWTLHALQ